MFFKQTKVFLKDTTRIEQEATLEIQERYLQENQEYLDDLFIKFMKEEGIDMPEYNILSDDGNKIVYEEVTRNAGEVEREQITTYRARIEAIRANIESENAEIVELELAIEKGEMLIEIANKKREEEQPVEVVLLSRNSPETGLRVFKTIQHYGLNISRAGFFSGGSPYKYLPAFNASLFLSADEEDIKKACQSGYAAGRVLDSKMNDDEIDDELRLAFDFDGVLVTDEAEQIYQKDGMPAFHKHETDLAETPLDPGLLGELFKKISYFQKMETRRQLKDPHYKRILNTSIVTARNAPSHERLINTIKSWGVDVNEAFFLGGIDKSRILDILHPHMFFDDQLRHLSHLKNIPAVHIPFGISNKTQ